MNPRTGEFLTDPVRLAEGTIFGGLEYSADGRRLIYVDHRSLQILDGRTRALQKRLEIIGGGPVVLSADGRTALVAGPGQDSLVLQIVNLDSVTVERSVTLAANRRSYVHMALAGDGTTLAISGLGAGKNGLLEFRKASNGEAIQQFETSSRQTRLFPLAGGRILTATVESKWPEPKAPSSS
jgi:hypothetical protein